MTDKSWVAATLKGDGTIVAGGFVTLAAMAALMLAPVTAHAASAVKKKAMPT